MSAPKYRNATPIRKNVYKSSLTPTSDKRGTRVVVREEAIPVIFIPGIMGSNLKAKNDIINSNKGKDNRIKKANDPIWRVDSNAGAAMDWATKQAADYQLLLQGDKLTVDDRGSLSAVQHLPKDLARQRGWGQVGADSYVPFLDWLQWVLSHAEAVPQGQTSIPANFGSRPLKGADTRMTIAPKADFNLLADYDFPVYAFGYNWLESNDISGKKLAEFISQTISHHQQNGFKCEKVILLTHSMGGLVARAACMLHGAKDQVLGVYHNCMPTDGAAASYKRLMTGMLLEDTKAGIVLGNSGITITSVFAMNAGPLELMPNKRYNNGQPWLFIKDNAGKVLLQLPKTDPYKDIYKEKVSWWRAINPQWLNPAGLSANAPKIQDSMNTVDSAKSFHERLQQAGDFHPNTHALYGADKDKLSYGTVTWTIVNTLAHYDLAGTRSSNDKGRPGVDLEVKDSFLPIRAVLSKPDVWGDGTVPAKESASTVGRGVHKGDVMIVDSGYGHQESYNVTGHPNNQTAALQAIVKMVKSKA